MIRRHIAFPNMELELIRQQFPIQTNQFIRHKSSPIHNPIETLDHLIGLHQRSRIRQVRRKTARNRRMVRAVVINGIMQRRRGRRDAMTIAAIYRERCRTGRIRRAGAGACRASANLWLLLLRLRGLLLRLLLLLRWLRCLLLRLTRVYVAGGRRYLRSGTKSKLRKKITQFEVFHRINESNETEKIVKTS